MNDTIKCDVIIVSPLWDDLASKYNNKMTILLNTIL